MHILQTLLELAISQLVVYEIENSKQCIHPGFTASKPETLMQSTLTIHIKEKANKMSSVSYSGSKGSSTAFNLCTARQLKAGSDTYWQRITSPQTLKTPHQNKNPQTDPTVFKAHTRTN